MRCSIHEISGDLFYVDDSFSMATCVSADLRMDRGIAVKFRNKFGCINILRQQNVKPGGVAILYHKRRFIYYLVTKQKSWCYDSTYNMLQCSMIFMRAHMIRCNVTRLAMPRVGCGVDGLAWPTVKAMIEKIFRNDLVTILVFHYTPPTSR